MDTHHIHDQKIDIHSGAAGVQHWLEHGLTKDGLRQLQERAERGEKVHFADGEGRKFVMEHNPEKGFHVDVRHH
ncbi:hypothetical protein A3A95_01990 [Candidatus Nomurabacteria bacterium RIFCSPLOWO2_01_FULL_39_18]|uniref:Uncharacterized protein n=1 Tax=Candidatus Nomurabacteria bacterium RIFCSPHIGHO2_01_FULL_40_24b TaxID=1801739 RepID=A0A1F6V9B5_9BACT|nr:MAG: hypothetical protein A2647_00725 [Candidatus Nomurabacteria bacterium RIFCSPHIGHO2_01_FULL_40_24b]OGI90635.1 MAG: hypothetical protein A3A95_01990 [Candidatus Nomurabacteria bacterium RIFCSPLOWO2_01_FULL_39_18]